jgi:hypothetical protein
MRRLVLFGLFAASALIILAGTGQAVGAQTETETPTPTDSPTPTETPTGTAIATASPTPTANPYRMETTLASGQAVAIEYTISGGEALISVQLFILIGLVLFGLLILTTRR